MSQTVLDQIKDTLSEAGYKLTPQREVTVQVMIDQENERLSAEEIYLKVKNNNVGIGLATVYRTLEILTDLNILNKVTFQDGLARYDLNKHPNQHKPHYLLCLSCGKIEEVASDHLKGVEEEIESQYHFKIKDHRLIFHGICQECQMKESQDELE